MMNCDSRVVAAVALASALILTAGSASAIPPTSWEAAGQFDSNCPLVGRWTSGLKPSALGAFSPLKKKFNGLVPTRGCKTKAATYPLVQHNPNEQPATIIGSGPVTYPARGMVLHPGPSGQWAVQRFRAPAFGSYKISGRFYAIQEGSNFSTTDVSIVKVDSSGSTALFTDTINGAFASQKASFTSLSVVLSGGDFIDFQVGPGGFADFSFDSTGLHAVIEGDGCDPDLPPCE